MELLTLLKELRIGETTYWTGIKRGEIKCGMADNNISVDLDQLFKVII